MDLWREFHGPNAGYILDLFEKYRQDPQAVDPAVRSFFSKWSPPESPVESTLIPQAPSEAQALGLNPAKVAAVSQLANSIRSYGHFAARLDPLGSAPPEDPSLFLETYGLAIEDLEQIPAWLVGGPIAEQATNAAEAIARLRNVYASTLAHDYLQIRNPEERAWLVSAAESGRFRPDLTGDFSPMGLLEFLTRVEVFEQFIQRTFPGKTRFSVEGLDMLVPMLERLTCKAAEAGIYHVLIGMAHRGRLNVLAHVLNKPYEQILAEFKDPLERQNQSGDIINRLGDVKYHAGAQRAILDDVLVEVTINMAPNPSHLEAVNPIIEGMARAAGTRADRPGAPLFDPTITLPVLIHGDASFPGQGVVAETLNMHRLEGYTTGGTIHIIANNQLGYTTNPQSSRSSLFASDLAKGFRIPIVHVNADDPLACMTAIQLAFAYRARYHKDFLIDLVGYRRHGHNEGDEPAFTQPALYRKIEAHPSVLTLWTQKLIEQGLITQAEQDQRASQVFQELQQKLENVPQIKLSPPPAANNPTQASTIKLTAPTLERLERINRELMQLPAGFHMHAKLKRNQQKRENMAQQADAPLVEWSLAEELAFATLLEDAIPIRLTGQDVERGTFSQRHAVLHDAETGRPFVPLQNLPGARVSFEIHNSPLSENAALGYEIGYNLQAPGRLVIWEAQYGDFINSAQVVVDEFLVSGREKWGQEPSLVLLLPHGYEGAGPDHSSARLERFLSAAAGNNLRVANCTSAAQYFHLLRRQAALLRSSPAPLVIMSPKSLLRHPFTASTPRELAEGEFHPVLDDPQAADRQQTARRLLLCSGKVGVDLLTAEQRQENTTAVLRLEQLSPFPATELARLIAQYRQATEVFWVQEEPENMGAWEFIRPQVRLLLPDHLPLRKISRPRSSSPAEGSHALHMFNQRALIGQAYSISSGAGTTRSRQSQEEGSR